MCKGVKNEHELLNTVFSALVFPSDVTRQFTNDNSRYDNRMNIMEKQESRIKSVKASIDEYETKITASFTNAKMELRNIEDLITNAKISLNKHRVEPSLGDRALKVATDTVAEDGIGVESLPVGVKSVFQQLYNGGKKSRRTRKNNKAKKSNK